MAGRDVGGLERPVEKRERHRRVLVSRDRWRLIPTRDTWNALPVPTRCPEHKFLVMTSTLA
jgi:hypothetical protein